MSAFLLDSGVAAPRGEATDARATRPPCGRRRRASRRFAAWLGAVLLAVTGAVFGPAARAAEPPVPRLTLEEAEQSALKNHPRISAAQLRALAAKQVVRETRAAFFPSLFADATAVGTAENNARISAGGLNNPFILERNAEGATLTQLITDFGRTASLTSSAKSRAVAEQQNVAATRNQIFLALDTAYFNTLQAQAVLHVALQTVGSRQLVLDQIRISATNKLKSELDVSFAAVSLGDAQLLVAKASNDLNAAWANLADVMGSREARRFALVEVPMPPGLTNNDSDLIAVALQQRPDLLQFRAQRDAAYQYAKAEKRLVLPTISAVGAAGTTPIRDPRMGQNYAAAGVDLSLPLFTGGLYAARRSEAVFRAQEADQQLRDLEDNIIRDVRVARLNVDYALQRMALTEQQLENAREALDLATARLTTGLSSIVELTQAQLNEISAEVGLANAKYDYHIQRAILAYQLGQWR